MEWPTDFPFELIAQRWVGSLKAIALVGVEGWILIMHALVTAPRAFTQLGPRLRHGHAVTCTKPEGTGQPCALSTAFIGEYGIVFARASIAPRRAQAQGRVCADAQGAFKNRG